jgi:hypothetical protein
LRPFPAYSPFGDYYATRIGIDGDKYYTHCENAVLFDVTIGPGECVYIPSFWWHHVESLEDSVSLAFFRPMQTDQSHIFLGARNIMPYLHFALNYLSARRSTGHAKHISDNDSLMDAYELVRQVRRARGRS